MGNDQSRSSSGGDKDAAANQPLDYYELLEIDEEATFDDIKRSYRRLALRQHPDKNPHRVEEATKLFADLQQAYEVLSDPNERAFYDNHRNVQAPTTDDDLYEHFRNGSSAQDANSKLNKRGKGEPGVSLEQLMRFFDPSLARKVDDSQDGFFTVYRNLFALLASDEALHTDHPLDYPSFGNSETPYAPPKDATRAEKDAGAWARDFYVVWSEFASEKKFEWVAKWDVDRGSDRQMRRLMERDNKKIRDDYKREYSEAVRQLALFLQHRDPRYKRHQERLRATRLEAKRGKSSTPNGPKGAADSANIHKTAQETAAARERAAMEYEQQEWQRLQLDPLSDESEPEEEEIGDGTAVRQETDNGDEIFECVACNKNFLSEASWDNHERSKKHKQAVWRLRKEMELEDETFGFPASDPPADEASQENGDDAEDDSDALQSAIIDSLEDLEIEETSKKSKPKKKRRGPTTPQSNLDAPVEQETGEESRTEEPVAAESVPQLDEERPVEISKRDKRRARESRRKAEEEAQKAALKEDRKSGRKTKTKGDTTAQQNEKLQKTDDFVTPKKKGKARVALVPDDIFAEEKVVKVVETITQHREKIVDRWGEGWTHFWKAIRRVYCPSTSPSSSDSAIPTLKLLCLGLGKPYSDRSAQIQLALLLELSSRLQTAKDIEAFDPASDRGDLEVLNRLGVKNLTDNKVGKYVLDDAYPHLVYMPHCSRHLYETILEANFNPGLARQPARVLLGNDLAEYIGFTRVELVERPLNEPSEENDADFQTAKKKRKGKGPRPTPKDGVLERLVPHMSVLPMSSLPETNLPGCARAFLSLSFQWLPEDKIGSIDWDKPLPEIVIPDDGEVLA